MYLQDLTENYPNSSGLGGYTCSPPKHRRDQLMQSETSSDSIRSQ